MHRTVAKYVVLLFMAALVGCGSQTARPVRVAAHEIAGGDAERVAQVTAIIAKYSAPPSAIAAAHWREEQFGDGELGPSDFRTFGMITVAAQDIARWQRMLVPLNTPAAYAAPTEPRPWWIAPEDFSTLHLYQPGPLTGSGNGWIGIAPASGNIYIYSFTT